MKPARAARPQGNPTRGTTAPNRLRRVDRWVTGTCLRRLSSDTSLPLAVDLGFGATPITTSELFARLRPHLPSIEVIGAEIDPQRVSDAQTLAQPGLSFVHAGFELAPLQGRPVQLLRAFNVLRQYDEDDVACAWAMMISHLSPHGLVIEGTCDEIGRRAVWVALDRQGPQTVTFSWRLAGLQTPSVIAERLPKVLIHRNIPGERAHDWLQSLDSAWANAAGWGGYGARQRFIATASSLRAAGWPVCHGPGRWRLGELTLPWSAVAPVDGPLGQARE